MLEESNGGETEGIKAIGRDGVKVKLIARVSRIKSAKIRNVYRGRRKVPSEGIMRDMGWVSTDNIRST